MKYILYSIFFLTSLMMLQSCTSEDYYSGNANFHPISLDVIIPSSEIRTRTFGDGSTVSTITCYFYDQETPDQAAFSKSETIPAADASGKRGLKIEVDLPENKTYDAVIIATANQEKVSYNSNEKTINLNYSKIKTNDEDVDCFFAVVKNINKDKEEYTGILLKRPLAQINIGTNDLESYNQLSTSSIKNTTLSLNGVYSKFNVINGVVSGSTQNITLSEATIPSSQTFPVPNNSYIAMTYILADEVRKNMTANLTVTANNNNSFSNTFNSIPFQKNYQTNIYGSLLTDNKDIKVEIIPGFNGNSNQTITQNWDDYDLVLKVRPDYKTTSDVCTVAKTYYPMTVDDNNVIDLKKFVDSKYYVKIRWSDINFLDTKNLNLGNVSKNTCITEVLKCDISKLTNLTHLDYFFNNCKDLINIDVIKDWNTEKIISMNNLFGHCEALQTLDVSNLNTSRVSEMRGMFAHCKSLTHLNLTNFDTSSVTDMSLMFNHCEALTQLNLTNFDTSKVTTMQDMFFYCSSLSELDVSTFNTSNVKNMSGMFAHIDNVRNLDLSSFDTSKVTTMSSMFSFDNFDTLNLSSFNVNEVIDMSHMFSEATVRQSNILDTFDCPKVETMESMFIQADMKCFSPKGTCKLRTPNVKNMNYMFDGYKGSSLYLNSFDTSNVTDMDQMFNSNNIRYVDVSTFNTSNVINMNDVWGRNLTELDISNFAYRGPRKEDYGIPSAADYPVILPNP